MFEFNIENIVFSANIAEKLNVQYLSKQFPKSKYNTNEFSGIIIDLNNPKCAVFLHPNGKLICTGLKNIDDIEIIVNRLITDIENNEIRIFEDIHIDIENIIASSNLKKKLDLNFIKDNIEFENIIYNTEDIPKLEFTISKSNIDIILFESGKIIFINVKDLEDIKDILKMLNEKFVDMKVL